MTWLNTAKQIKSLGLTVDRVTSRAGLAERRRQTHSQYFTPEWVGRKIWQMLSPVVSAADEAGTAVTAIDTSVGSGRLLEHAPETVALYGTDIDARCIEALWADAAESGRDGCTFQLASLADLVLQDFTIGVINPPFSITLQGADLEQLPSNSFGPFGPGTSALSHIFATEQAIRHCQFAVCLLPQSALAAFEGRRELMLVADLPSNTFQDEGANVATSLLVFHFQHNGAPKRISLTPDTDVTALLAGLKAYPVRSKLRIRGRDATKDKITLPVTHSRRVRLVKAGLKIGLKFGCGLTMAKVMNAVLDTKLVSTREHRYPTDMAYSGSGRLLIAAHIAQPDPWKSLEALCDSIRDAGGLPEICPSLKGHFEKAIRRHARAVVPFQKWIQVAAASKVKMTARVMTFLDIKDMMSPVVRPGQVLEASPVGGAYEFKVDDQTYTLTREAVERSFTFEDERLGDTGWQLIHPGKAVAFPAIAHELSCRLDAAGIDWLWPWQRKAVIEALVHPYGATLAWEQGTGKARSSIAMALIAGGHNLIVVESGLIPEMLLEIRDRIGTLPETSWQLIETAEHARNLRKVNIISYNRLKAVVDGRGRRIADLIAGKANIAICDEGGLLSNSHSQQSEAVGSLKVKRTYVMDGTPIRGYPRDMLPLLQATTGGAMAHQPYSNDNRAEINSALAKSARHSMRGVDAFREEFCVFEWVTNEFKEDLQKGAKREIPRIKSPGAFRQLLNPSVFRILRGQPEVSDYVCTKEPQRLAPELVEWDRHHLEYYLKVATEFSQWYIRQREALKGTAKGLGLEAILARISAVEKAANAPMMEIEGAGAPYSALTSKMRRLVRRLSIRAAEGRKSIVYIQNPIVIDRIAIELEKAGIECVKFHGQMDIKARTRDLHERFRKGSAKVLLSSWVGQRGLNLPEASCVIFYSRNWSAVAEEQAIARILRPDQVEDVLPVEYLQLEGSIDEYMAQVVDWKKAAAAVGLDYGDGATDSEEFRHLDTILMAFCKQTLEMSPHEILGAHRAA